MITKKQYEDTDLAIENNFEAFAENFHEIASTLERLNIKVGHDLMSLIQTERNGMMKGAMVRVQITPNQTYCFVPDRHGQGLVEASKKLTALIPAYTQLRKALPDVSIEIHNYDASYLWVWKEEENGHLDFLPIVHYDLEIKKWGVGTGDGYHADAEQEVNLSIKQVKTWFEVRRERVHKDSDPHWAPKEAK